MLMWENMSFSEVYGRIARSSKKKKKKKKEQFHYYIDKSRVSVWEKITNKS